MSTLGTLSKELKDKLTAITLPPHAIGRYATMLIPLTSAENTIGDVHKMLIDHARDFVSINYIYVVSDKGRLQGVISVKEVFANTVDKIVEDIMQKKVVKAHPQTDRERVAHMALSENIKAIPIVDDNGYFLGAVTADNIEKILESESKEDLLKLSGIIGSHDSEIDGPILGSFKNRIPWIIIGLLGGLITASVIGGFEQTLSENLILASFIPLIAYTANAVANQTQTIYIRELAIEAKIKFQKYVLRQLFITFMIALVCSAVMILMTAIFWGSIEIGLIVAIAMSAAILTSTFLSLIIPNLMKRYALDPAVASGPFATVIQDFLSVTIYFTVAKMLL